MNHSSSERRNNFFSSVVEALPCSGCFPTCMGAHFPAVEQDNAIRFSILCRMSGLLWHGSKWSRRFGRSLQYTPGLEVLACSFDTDFNYVTSMLQLCLSLNHFVKTCKEMMDFRTSFSDVFSGTYINPRGALSWTRDPLLNFPAKCINFEIPS